MITLPCWTQEAADSKKNALTAAYEQLHDMLTQEENAALQAVDAEMHNGQIKLKTLMKKFSQNVTNMNKAKKSIHSLLSRTQTLDFLQVRSQRQTTNILLLIWRKIFKKNNNAQILYMNCINIF